MTGRFEHFDAHSGGSYRVVMACADASAAREVRRRLRRGRRHGRPPRRRPITRRYQGRRCAPTGSTLQITRRDCRPRWTISPLPLNAECRLPRSTVLVATATIRFVAAEGQIYGRQLQQAGDYTGPHRGRPAARGRLRVEAFSAPADHDHLARLLMLGPGLRPGEVELIEDVRAR
jgi:hypothetical protein